MYTSVYFEFIMHSTEDNYRAATLYLSSTGKCIFKMARQLITENIRAKLQFSLDQVRWKPNVYFSSAEHLVFASSCL